MHKKIGIWGFGKTGQSVLAFLAQHPIITTHFPLTEPATTLLATPFEFFTPKSQNQPQNQSQAQNTQESQKIYIFESNELTQAQHELIKQNQATLVPPELLPQFLELCDVIIPSPGVDITSYQKDYPEKFLSELDLFFDYLKIPVIAITGSLGKTSTVHLLTQLLNKLGKKARALGNIGTPVLDGIETQDQYDYFVIELSSFQLEHIRRFAPDIAVILNIFPNHLDRHGTLENYLNAKGKLLAHARNSNLATSGQYAKNEHVEIKKQLEILPQTAILPMDHIDLLWPLVTHQQVIWVGQDAYQEITSKLSNITAKSNLQIILTILETILEPVDFEPETVLAHAQELTRPEHRLELVTVPKNKNHKNILVYNDSKSTIPTATLTALTQVTSTNNPITKTTNTNQPNQTSYTTQTPTLSPTQTTTAKAKIADQTNTQQNVILFLGGLSKGVDRQTALIKQLATADYACHLKQIICFGQEAEQLHQWCQEEVLASSAHKNLELAVAHAVALAQSGDIILFSPAGSSYDLFKNFEERGACFKRLICS